MANEIVDITAIAPCPQGGGVLKYEFLRSEMAAAIDRGAWQAGAQVPPELDIAAATKLSLGTVQRALRELAAQGYVERRHGHGTFVADRGLKMSEPLHCRFVDAPGQDFLPVYTRMVDRRIVTEPFPWEQLIGPDPKGAVRFDRSIDIDGRFRVASRMYLHASRFGQLMEMPESAFDGANLKKLLAKDLNVAVRNISQRFRIEQATDDIRAWTNSDAEMVMAIRAVGLDASERPVYYQELRFPPTDIDLQVLYRVD